MACVSAVPEPGSKTLLAGKGSGRTRGDGTGKSTWDQGALHQMDGQEGQRLLHHHGADSWAVSGGSLEAPWLAYNSASSIPASPVCVLDERGDIFHCRISRQWDVSVFQAGEFL